MTTLAISFAPWLIRTSGRSRAPAQQGTPRGPRATDTGRRPPSQTVETPAARWVPARRPILEAVEWPGLQPLHSTSPWPDANRLAHETIHEQTRQGRTDPPEMGDG